MNCLNEIERENMMVVKCLTYCLNELMLKLVVEELLLLCHYVVVVVVDVVACQVFDGMLV